MIELLFTTYYYYNHVCMYVIVAKPLDIGQL